MASASHNVEIQPGQQPVFATDFWNDSTIELSDTNVKKRVPALPEIGVSMETLVGGGMEVPAYLALQVAKAKDKKVLVRAMASAAAWFLDSTENLTGSSTPAITLTGLEAAIEDDAQENAILKTNFTDAEPVTIGELLDLMDVDADELGSYFGVLFLAANKKASRKNLSAFNDNRRSAALASCVSPPKIFVPDSMFLTLNVLTTVYASMLSFNKVRTVLTSRVVEKMEKPHEGPALAFMSTFALLNNSGMSALAIIKEATLKHQWIRHEFPELRPEFTAANEAMKILKGVPERERPFIKAIHGNSFVPVAYSQIDNLTGVCKEILKRTTPSYQNYEGGRFTENQLAIINRHTEAVSNLAASVSAE